MPHLTIAEIYQAARTAGFTPEQATTWTAIAMAESGGNTGALNDHGEYSMGLWQINVGPGVRHNVWGNLNDPVVNAKAAYDISHHGTDMRPWTTTHDANKGTSADYRMYLPQVEALTGVQGDDRGVGGYGSPLPPPLPSSGDPGLIPAGTTTGTLAYDQIDSGMPPGAQADDDRDGLTNAFERLSGTAVNSADTDHDSLSDAYELAVSHSNPTLADTDHDGLSDSTEAALGTSASSWDSDQDSLSDKVEVQYGSDPLHADTGDGTAPLPVAAMATTPGLVPAGTVPAVPDTTGGLAPAGTVPAVPSTTGAPQSFQGKDPWAKVNVDGETVDNFTAAALQAAAQEAGTHWHILQGSFTEDVSASGSTHAGGGVVDVSPTDGDWEGAVTALRKIGFAAWIRNVPGHASVGSGAHIHAVLMGDKLLSDQAAIQVQSYLHDDNGLAGSAPDDGPRQFIHNRFSWDGGVVDPTASLAGYDQIDVGQPVSPTDSDHDGLTDAFERLAGTNPHSMDSDHDGLSDAQEAIGTHTDPLSRDTDADGRSDRFEFLHHGDAGSLPGVAGVVGQGIFAENVRHGTHDFDHDGISNVVEHRLHLDPNSADTDHDGLSDSTELSLGTDPTMADSDHDGFSDAFEVQYGSDPLHSGVALPTTPDALGTTTGEPDPFGHDGTVPGLPDPLDTDPGAP